MKETLKISLDEVIDVTRCLFGDFGESVLILNESHRILTANSSALRLFGYQSEKILDLSFYDLVEPTFLKKTNFQIKACENFELIGMSRQQTLVPLECSLSMREVGGGLIWVALLKDISLRKQAEARLQRVT